MVSGSQQQRAWLKPARGNFRQRGASFIEFTIVAIPLFLLGALGIELIRFNQSRLMVIVALNEAMRTCITNHGNPVMTLATFEQALLPLFAPAGRYATIEDRQRKTKQRFQSQTGSSPWRVVQLAPDKNDFADFAHPILTQRSGRATIRNSYMAEQHQDRIRSGWLSGKGPKSGNDIFEANTVRLQATYLHQPLTPGVGFVMRTLMRSQDTYIANGYRNGLVAIQVEQHGMMQSNAMLW